MGGQAAPLGHRRSSATSWSLFGLVSSVFDFLTFGVLLLVFQAAPEEFRTGWFIESLLTELVIALVVRTRAPVLPQPAGDAAAGDAPWPCLQ